VTDKLTPAKENQFLRKIEKYKKALRKEKATFKAYHDGGGYRYEIAELYFKLGDYKQTNRYLNWFDKNFPDDAKYAYFDLGKAVTKFELGKETESKLSTVELNRHNTYLIDLLIGNETADQNKYEWMQSESLTWAQQQLAEHRNLVTETYIAWLSAFVKEDVYTSWYTRLISIKKLLKGMEVSSERSDLLKAERRCMHDWKMAIKKSNKT